MDNPFISWREWESHILDFFRFVLPELIKEPNLPHLEAHKAKDNLNRRLALICRKKEVIWETQEKNRPSITLYFGGRNQPRTDDTLPHQSEQKEPDFQVFKFINQENMMSHSYSVECKRLDLANDGSPHGKCDHYVNDGILRFMKREYSYGIDVESGLMIAYVQSSDFDTFYRYINHYCEKSSIPYLIQNSPWKTKDVSELKQSLHRTEMQPADFQLHHFWVDLR